MAFGQQSDWPHSQIDGDAPETTSMVPPRRSWQHWYIITALLLLIALAGVVFYVAMLIGR